MASNNEEILLKLKAIDELTPVMLKALQAMEANTAKMTASLDRVAGAADVAKPKMEDMGSKALTVGTVFIALKEAAELVAGAVAKVAQQFQKAIDEALAAEKATNMLNGALVSTGQYSKQAAKDIEEYAKAVQEATGADDDQTKTLIAKGVQMGLSIEQSKEMEEAARKLAFATGKDAESSFKALSAALSGNAATLARVVPQVKELTAGQLKAGGANALLNKMLEAQYKLYEGSFSASLAKAKSSVGDMYQAVGELIIQNPLVIKAVSAFSDWTTKLTASLEKANVWVKAHQKDIEQFMVSFGKAITIGAAALGVWAVAALAAAGPTAILGAAIAVLTSPVTLTIAAVAGLTAAFMKWPGLFDVIIGGMKAFIGMAIIPFTGGLALMLAGMGKVVGVFDKEWGASISKASSGIMEMNAKLIANGVEQVKTGVESIKTQKSVDKSTQAYQSNTKAIEANMQAASDRNAKALAEQDTFNKIAIGTDKQREALETEAQERDKALKEFESWLASKRRLAVSSEEEQAAAVNAVRAKEVGGTGGTQGNSANAQAAIDAEMRKQAEIANLRQMGILNQAQMDEAMLASQQRAQQAELSQAQAHAQAMADILGQSEDAFALRQQIEEERFQLSIQNRLMRAEQEGATEFEIKNMREQSELEHLARMNEMEVGYYEQQAQLHEQAGNSFDSSLAKIRASQVKHGQILGAIQGAQQTQEFQGLMGGLSNMSALRGSHSRKAFDAGKKAAIAEATVKTFLAATSAYASLAGIPFIGPVLGAAAAAAAIGAGLVNIQKIQAQKFEGGQADSGMDSVPQALSGKSFVLSGGERVVQPTANRDLTNFLNKEQGGSGARGGQYNITLHYNGNGSEGDARKMAEMVVKEIRSMSERGTPIMSEKGLIRQ